MTVALESKKYVKVGEPQEMLAREENRASFRSPLTPGAVLDSLRFF